ncbi:MAG: hypothetical protein WD512_08010, partial [Candidatus Paceibacterota bacterium]
MTKTIKKLILLVLATTLVIFSASQLIKRNIQAPGIDFYHYWVVPLVLSSQENNYIYNQTVRKEKAAYFY